MQPKKYSDSAFTEIREPTILRALGALLLLLCLQGCSEESEPARQVHTSFSETSGLTVSDTAGLSQQLIGDSLGVRVVLSGDARWLLVEDMQLSNLVVVRAFRYTGEAYQEVSLPVLRKYWEALARESGLEFEDLVRPAIGIEGFGPGENSVLLHFRADSPGLQHPGVNSVVEIPLEPDEG